MKIVNLFFQVIILIILFGLSIFYLTGYDSAFEADQSCHSYLLGFDDQVDYYGCDHDTETHQWILYDKENKTKPARIVKKFRYKFL